ncbi:MAG: very short patch repair endonuclease [Candidatus Cloacimonetes bacterium]|jgi:DNA mismatch endonuclease (patch repair protein)|nr:very short patch repair endonuclease [Candidatus Cloacimonadota bacterium]
MDKDSAEIRSRIMSSVNREDTGPEMQIRRALHKKVLRYRLHVKELPGSPDIVFPQYKAVLFVHGCFWHRHGCKATTTPKTNVEYWTRKFDENVKRDASNEIALQNLGWKVAILWECAIKDNKSDLSVVAGSVLMWLKSRKKHFDYP